MGHGLRSLRVMLAALAVLMCSTATAHAYVYWTNPGPGISTSGTTLGRTNLDGSGVNHAFITGATSPTGIAIGGGSIYWINSQTNAIGRAALDGSSADQSFVSDPTGTSTVPSNLAADSSHLYWVDGNRWVGRVPLAGGNPQPHWIDMGAGSFPLGIAIDNGTLYANRSGEIVHVPTSGGVPQTLVTLPANFAATSLAAGGGYVYAAGADLSKPPPSGAIIRVQVNGNGLNPSFVSNLVLPVGVAVDSGHVYWAEHGAGQPEIGRARLTTGDATDVQPDFVTEAGGPGGVAVDAGIDPTATSIACNPASVAKGSPTTCTVTVHDSASTAPPSGTVNVTGDATTFFQGNPCQLTPLPAGGGSSCVVGADPTNSGTETITAAYAGDAVHQPSSGTLDLCAGATGPCGSSPPPPPKPSCVVPKLRGKSLAKAKALLSQAHCKLGKIKRPRHSRHHHLVVGSQSPRAGKRLKLNARVAVKLVRAQRH